MLDKTLIKLTKFPLQVISKPFIKFKISANTITLTGIPTSIGIFLSILMGQFTLALILILLNRVLDGVDGQIARETNTKSVSGGFLDIIVDYVFYTCIPLGMAFYSPQDNALISALVLFTYTLSGVMFMASSSAAAKLNLTSNAFSQKSLYYPINIIEGGETILYCILIAIFPTHYALLSYIMMGLLLSTMPIRALLHFKTFKDAEKTL